MGDGHRLDFPLAGLTLANVEPGLGNAKKMEESWFMEIGPARIRRRVHCAIGQTSKGSFSAVSKPNFASKYAFELLSCSKRRLRKREMFESS